MRDPWAFQRWAFEQETGNPVRKAVLSMLAMLADSETGRCEAKQATLAQGVEAGDRAVRGHLRALEEMGLIARRPQFRRDRGRRGDEFLLLAPWVAGWPDGDQLANDSGGSNGRQLPGGAEQIASTPRNGSAGQELPLTNGHVGTKTTLSDDGGIEEWPGVMPTMQADAEAFLGQKRKVGGRLVTDAEMQIAASALAEFNRQLGSRFELGPHLGLIVARVRDHPSWNVEAHVRLVQSAFRVRWWERRGGQRRAKPAVVWGSTVFPNVVDDATREAEARRELEEDCQLRTKVFSGNRRWDELTRREQDNAKEAVTMGLRPWEPGPGDTVPAPRRQANGSGLTAATFADE